MRAIWAAMRSAERFQAKYGCGFGAVIGARG